MSGPRCTADASPHLHAKCYFAFFVPNGGRWEGLRTGNWVSSLTPKVLRMGKRRSAHSVCTQCP